MAFLAMRTWFKYIPARSDARVPIDRDFEAHAAGMGGYSADSGYDSRHEFFERYLESYHTGRLTHYRDFLLRHLTKEMEILSIASGRSALELWLTAQGYDIVCSDLAEPPCASATRALFPDWRFEILDILERPAGRPYDAITCLSLIYLFDKAQFTRFFENVALSLRPGGMLLLDSAGAPDNVLSRLVHDVWLPAETYLLTRYAQLNGVEAGVITKHHGFRRTESEVLQAARGAGFELLDRQGYAPLTDFKRSVLFNRFVKPGSLLEGLFERIGRLAPYIRMWGLKLANRGEAVQRTRDWRREAG